MASLVKSAPKVLEDGRVGELADMFRMMGDPSRLRILLACMGEPVSVGEIARRLGLSQSLVSHHLRLLRATRLLRAERRGMSANPPDRGKARHDEPWLRQGLLRTGNPGARK